jgi:hypothetical protein
VKILVTGRENGGSWQIRAVQLGAAIGALVQPNAGSAKGFDVAIVVKRARQDLLDRIRGIPVIWDVVDAYSQAGLEWTALQCRGWLASEVARIKPVAIVAATEAMAADCEGFGIPVLALPHHARYPQVINPIRKVVQTVGYEGREQYLGRWRSVLEQECKRRKWAFVVNPKTLASLDIVVAFRESRGYAATQWKSNVKLANAQGSGTPIVMQRDAGYMETASGAEWLADKASELYTAFDQIADHDVRWQPANRMLSASPSLELISDKYRAWLSQLRL